MKWNIFYWTFAKGVNLTYLWEEVRGESTHHMVCCLDVHHQAVWAQQHRTTLNKVRKLSQVGVIRHNRTSRQNEFLHLHKLQSCFYCSSLLRTFPGWHPSRCWLCSDLRGEERRKAARDRWQCLTRSTDTLPCGHLTTDIGGDISHLTSQICYFLQLDRRPLQYDERWLARNSSDGSDSKRGRPVQLYKNCFFWRQISQLGKMTSAANFSYQVKILMMQRVWEAAYFSVARSSFDAQNIRF